MPVRKFLTSASVCESPSSHPKGSTLPLSPNRLAPLLGVWGHIGLHLLLGTLQLDLQGLQRNPQFKYMYVCMYYHCYFISQ